MAIQLPDPGNGVPEDQTGDNEHVMWLKTRGNFSDKSNAASKEIGIRPDEIPLAQNTHKATLTHMSYDAASELTLTDLNDMPEGEIWGRVSETNQLNAPSSSIYGNVLWSIYHYKAHPALASYYRNRYTYQIAIAYTGVPQALIRVNDNLTWSEWQPIGQNSTTYNTTTAAGANVVVDSKGKLMRSTSSERYKDILAPLELDDARYADAMALKPIVYRSTASADNPAYHYYSFSAEALGALDPAFTLWRDTETVTDDEGNVTEQPLDERIAEGININALLAFSHAIAIKQDKMIKAQAEAIATLTERLDAMTAQ